MARFRTHKTALLEACAHTDWAERLRRFTADNSKPKTLLSPLTALLPRDDMRMKAVYGLSLVVPALARHSMEEARVYMRRLMWGMNEESGNLGWGIPEAMGAVLAASPALAAEYGRILCSYGYQTGKDDNFIDHAPLRRGVYWGVGRMAGASPEHTLSLVPHLPSALADPDVPLRGFAAFAAREIVNGTARKGVAPTAEALDALRRLPDALRGLNTAKDAATTLLVLEGDALSEKTVAELAASALAAVEQTASSKINRPKLKE